MPSETKTYLSVSQKRTEVLNAIYSPCAELVLILKHSLVSIQLHQKHTLAGCLRRWKMLRCSERNTKIAHLCDRSLRSACGMSCPAWVVIKKQCLWPALLNVTCCSISTRNVFDCLFAFFSFNYSFMYLFVYSFFHAFIDWFIHSLI